MTDGVLATPVASPGLSPGDAPSNVWVPGADGTKGVKLAPSLRTPATYLFFAVLALVFTPGQGYGQEPSSPRIVEYATEPDSVAVGQQFELRVTLRAGPDVTVLMPDTLLPADGARSVAAGTWTVVPAPEDSIDIRAVYPLIGLQEGLVALPAIELALRPREGSLTERIGSAALPGMNVAQQGFTIRAVPIGAVQLGAYGPLAEADSTLVPRPAADVVGRQWSMWIVLGAVTSLLLVVAAGLAWFTGWWSRVLAPLLFRTRPLSARHEASRELERIRSLGWHRDGRVDEFYAASTDALRHYAGRIDPAWVPALTSRELLRRLQERWGDNRVGQLAEVIDTAERVKFGRDRPESDRAEVDWSAIRDWIIKSPEA